ncbi:MAG TPA: hypothetical protein VI195_00560, partial [Steroidobacteraceae bacterium]
MSGNGLELANNGDSLPVAANGTFTFETAVASGSHYAVTVTQQPTGTPAQNCTISAASGDVGSANVTDVAVACANIARFAYIAAFNLIDAGVVWAFAIEPASGALTPVAGSPFSSGDETHSLAVHPSGRFLYAANRGGGNGANARTISVYSIDPSSG